MVTVTATCSLCEACCAALMHVEGDTIVRVEPDREDPLSGGFICAKGAAIPEVEADARRVRLPLLRKNGQLEPASWDECFAYIQERVTAIHAAHGRDAIAVYAGNGVAHSLGIYTYLSDVITALGSRNIFTAGTLDQIPRQAVSALLYGSASSVTVPDLDRCQLVWILGANPLDSNGSLMSAPGIPRRLQLIHERKGRVIVIDPRRTGTAKRADEHIAIRPSADAAFLAAVAHVLMTAGPKPSLALELCGDVEALRNMLAPFTPESVESACGIAAVDIRRLALELRDTPTAAVYGRIGTTTQQFSSLVCWLIDIVNILAGNMDVEGGAMFCKPLLAQDNTLGPPGIGSGKRLGRWRSRVRGAAETLGELPTVCLPEEIETSGDGQVRGLFVFAGNPAISNPNAKRIAAALDSLELLVCMDIYVNETGARAHVILPSPPRLAKSNYDALLYQFALRQYGRYTPAHRAPNAQERSDREILLRLANIAHGEVWQADIDAAEARTLERMVKREVAREGGPIAGRDAAAIVAELGRLPALERRLDFNLRIGPHGDAFGAREGIKFETLRNASHGLDLGPQEPRLPEILRTPSGRIEWLQPFAKTELERLQKWVSAERPRFVLVGRRQLRSNNSWMQHVKGLKHRTRRCYLQMNLVDAEREGLKSGDWVEVSTATGVVKVRVEVTADILAGVVSLPHGWSDLEDAETPDEAVQGANVNRMTTDAGLDPLTGTACLNGYAVSIRLLETRESVPTS